TLFILRESEGQRSLLFHGLFVSDALCHVLKLMCYLAVSAALVYSRQYLADRGLLRGEFVTLLLFALLGMMVMISAASFLTLFLGLELMSLCLYAMVALNRDSVASTEAAMKYFVLGALSSGLLLYGMSMIYGATGTLDIPEVARAVARLVKSESEYRFLVFGLVFVVAGLAFKVGVVPFHMWIPDVYHGAPTPVTLVISAGPKLAAFAMAIRLLVNGLPSLAADWQQMLALLALASMALGNIVAIAQSNLKRMLAYSAIAHMGFMLLGLLSGVVDGNARNAADAYSAALFYAIVYAIMSVGAFGVLLYLSRAGFDCENLEDVRGLNRTRPWIAFLMLVIMFSLTGIPPTAGFYAKLAVISAAVSAGYLWLAVAAVMFSLVGAFYYLRVVKLMYFDEPSDSPAAAGAHAGERRLGFGALLSANGLSLLLFGILPQHLMALCFAAVATL
ncbi:MAG: NADH-quinone oxidoreductase subunit NuoN, partial [Burkholderiales bacterium]